MTFRLRRAWRAGATAICGALLAGCVGIGGNTFDGGDPPAVAGDAGALPALPKGRLGRDGLGPDAAPAQSPRSGPSCARRDRMLAALGRRWGERLVSSAITGAGALLEVLATPDGATWSIIVTVPDGPTCLVSYGTDWRGLTGALADPEV